MGVGLWCWLGYLRAAVGSSAGRPQNVSAAPAARSPAQLSAQSHAGAKPGWRSPFGYRLANTTKSLDELMRSPRAILLENAFLDTGVGLDLPIPAKLRSQGDSGSYIVQCRGELNDAFRSTLGQSGAKPVAYIPNNAYLVRAQAEAAAKLAANPQVQAVVSYEPYYKIKPSLLVLLLAEEADPGAPSRRPVPVFEASQKAIETPALPGQPVESLAVNVLLFEDDQKATIARLREEGLDIFAQESSPFGTVAKIRCFPAMLARIAQLSGVQELEPSHSRVPANDLSRATIGVASDSTTLIDYLGLTGSNITVNVNDSGVDSIYPDLAGRVFWDVATSGQDSNGHGTHVAGIIASSGGKSLTVTNALGSVKPPVSWQFRGLAPAASIFSISVAAHSAPSATDAYLQQSAAQNKAFISNNSWHYADDAQYDLGAASYDAAVRDALPSVPGSRPLLCVFAAGNSGQGANNGTGGVADSIQSPGTAKNVITVGAIEQARFITNQTWSCSTTGGPVNCITNMPWLPLTDASNQVASFSSRGNVGIGIEGGSGRFKPDLVAPGTFVISARSTQWDQVGYYSRSNNSLNLAQDANYYQVLSNLNQTLGPFYRFESGTSLAAAEVSGTLALMQEFFQQRLLRTNSPALMKAILINGARPLAGGYDLHSSGATNSQGWGAIQLRNSLPGALTNVAAPSSSMFLFDQSPAQALATGQQQTRLVSLTPDAQKLPLRVTLVWTDPPGNPVAGLKLVNDLDLVVTNLQTGEVFWGNDFPPGGTFNSAWQPGSPARVDVLNNVENVYLAPTLGSNYSITVRGRRIGVNAVTEHPNDVVQDYALVISSGDGQITNALTLADGPLVPAKMPLVTPITNSFARGGIDFGTILPHERIGANAPLLATNSIPLPGASNAVIAIGALSQWHFYVFTNDTPFSNAVFLTFLPQPLSLVPGSGGSLASSTPGQLWPSSAELELYVSHDPSLTNLDPVVLAAADMSLGRGGEQTIVYSNALRGVYYIGVKCDSLQGAEYGLVADVSQQPFEQDDPQGNELLRGFPQPSVIPNGTPLQPGVGYVFYVAPDTIALHRVIVTNTIAYSAFSDLKGTLAHGSSSVVLNDYSTNASSTIPQTFIYDDSGAGDVPGAVPTDGPGSLSQFSGQDATGQWRMTLLDTNRPATNQSSWIFLEAQPALAGGMVATILPGNCREDFLAVPLQATNLTAIATYVSGTGPISLQVYPVGTLPSTCPSLVINLASANGMMSIDQTSNPPLTPGLYIIRTCNLGSAAVGVMIQASPGLSAASPSPNSYTSAAPLAIPDNALSDSTLMLTNTDRIVSAEVGVRINHPRISDLALTLISPDGTRVLLEGGRGGLSADGMGATLVVTNTTPVSFSGGPVAVTNTFDTGQTSGTIVINYDFYALPDDMKVYYEGNLLYDSGLVSFRGSTNINYGPGSSTSFTIVMNQGGNSQSNTAWFYMVTSTRRQPLYLTFTENTNLTITPIQFAQPPFTNVTVAPPGAPPANGIFYLPEESLAKLAGKSAAGQWKLEILDNRAGATNPPPMLLSWQLALWLVNPTPTPVTLIAAAPATNLLAPAQIQWYAVDVPDWANFATNSLLSATAPVNLWFNSATPPTGTNAGDLLLARNSTNGTWTFQTNTAPRLVPGSRYYIGVQNTNPWTVTVAFAVDFDIDDVVTLTSGVPYANTNAGPLNSTDYYRYVVSLNAVRVQFEINGPTSDVTLLARKGAPLPSLGVHDFISANPGTNDELIVVYDSSRPVSLSAGEWFLSVVNVTGQPAAYSILATEFAAYGTNILVTSPAVGTNTLCLTWSSLPGIHYYLQGKVALTDTNWTSLSPTLTASDFTTTFCFPLPSQFKYFRVSQGLVLVPALPIISSVAYSAGGVLLQWSAPTNSQFTLQWASSLAPANWRSFPGVVTSTSGTFSFFDDGSLTGGLDTARFYRLRQSQ